jgi:hypothetical protein
MAEASCLGNGGVVEGDTDGLSTWEGGKKVAVTQAGKKRRPVEW